MISLIHAHLNKRKAKFRRLETPIESPEGETYPHRVEPQWMRLILESKSVIECRFVQKYSLRRYADEQFKRKTRRYEAS